MRNLLTFWCRLDAFSHKEGKKLNIKHLPNLPEGTNKEEFIVNCDLDHF